MVKKGINKAHNHKGMDGRAVEGTGLENRQIRKCFVGSNPTPSGYSTGKISTTYTNPVLFLDEAFLKKVFHIRNLIFGNQSIMGYSFLLQKVYCKRNKGHDFFLQRAGSFSKN
jgi:hypothetical protein